MSTPITTTYARYLLPGAFVPEVAVREVRDRHPGAAALAAPPGAYAFCFFDRLTTTGEIDGEAVEMRSGEMHTGRWFYINGEVLDQAAVEAICRASGHWVLLENMRGNRWPAVVRCRAGNFQPFMPGDMVISHDGELAVT